MKKILLLAFCGIGLVSFSQISEGGRPTSFKKIISVDDATENPFDAPYDVRMVSKPDVASAIIEDEEGDQKGAYRIGLNIPLDFSIQNSGTWMELENGDKIWRLGIRAPEAMAITLYFGSPVQIPEGGKLHAYNGRKSQYIGAYTANTPGFQAMEMIQGDFITLEYFMPAGSTELPTIEISEMAYIYRGVEDRVGVFIDGWSQDLNRADACQVDVACTPEINGWEAQRDAVVHYSFVDGGTYVCSGAVVNNTNNDCTPYILSANHCGDPTNNSDIANHVWYFNYQRPTCSPGNTTPYSGAQSETMSGGTFRASSSHGDYPGGASQVDGSDFVLVELNSSIPASYDPYFAGWNRNTTASTSGVGIHHPAGHEKKISTYSSSLVSSTYNGGWSGAHWRVTWVATTNGHGVTEGGSSGSPIYDNNGRIVGHLSGGLSYCTATGDPDLYGKFNRAWDMEGAAANAQLEPWLDPGSTGAMTLDGTYMPCSPSAPVADFTASATQVAPSTAVDFTDLSTGTPTGWSWSVTPATGWSYTGGTSASDQNPQITFTNTGTYTVSLTASNAQGSDNETKVDYIEVTNNPGPCAATSSNCDEYIGNVTLETIDNSSGCTMYGDYTGMSTTLEKGSSYDVTVSPEVGGSPGAYTDDEIAVWIDFNDDGDFDDVGEDVGYLIVAGAFNPTFNFTVPAGAATGNVIMRCRISYQPDDGPIDPCGTSNWGEVEDYTITITDPAGAAPVANFVADQTVVNEGSTVSFTDLSTNSPTNWAWSISPASGWAYTGGTNAGSQNPQVDFTTAGTYTVSLTATNAGGSDTETKTNYITVETVSVDEYGFSTISVYPNPTSGDVTINISGVSVEVASVELRDITGRIIATGKNNNGIIVFNLDEEASGIYFVKINTAYGTLTKKVIRL